MCSTYFAHDAEKIMNTFVIAPRHLQRPLEAWRNRHKIRLWLRISYALIQRLSLQERFKVLYCGASFHPFSSSISLALWLYGEQFRSQDLQFLLELLCLRWQHLSRLHYSLLMAPQSVHLLVEVTIHYQCFPLSWER